MKKLSILILVIFTSLNTFAQLSDADIWMLDMQIAGEKIALRSPKNITNNKGYDNQPCFTPDGNYLFFSSVRSNDQTDIYRYDVNAGIVIPLAVTAESEYSPMVTPDGHEISCVRVERDSAQRIWHFSPKSGTPNLLLPTIDSVGYYTWINEDSLIVFVLTQPFTLQVADVKTQHTQIIVRNPGRCFARIPGKNEISYIDKKNDTTCVMYSMSLHDFTVKELNLCNGICSLGKTEDYVWLDADRFIFAVESKLYVSDKKEGRLLLTDMSAQGIKLITRLAVSPDKKRLVVVAQ